MKMECEEPEMPETGAKDLSANIDLSKDFSDRVSHLCMSENYSDVVFLVEDQRLPGHKCILATASTYFQSLLYGGLSESNKKEIKLEVPLLAFKALLRYIYSGKISLLHMYEEIVLDLLVLANKYGMTLLELAIVKYLQEDIALKNIFPIFKIAWHCEFNDLKEACYTFMNMNASNFLAHESFKDVSKELLEDIIRRDSFLASEFEIFSAVMAWSKQNRDADVTSVLLSYIRFPLMTAYELSIVRGMGTINVEKLLDAFEVRGDRNVLRNLPYRVLLGENMVALKYGSKLITGLCKENPSPICNLSDNQKDTNFIAKQRSCFEGIIVELGIPSVINHIEFQLKKSKSFSYILEVSKHQSEWERIVDYRYFICQNLQTLYFPPKYIKYIKLAVEMNTNVTISALKATYMENIPKQINGFIAATIKIYGATRVEGKMHVRSLFDNDYLRCDKKVIVQLDQPYFVGRIRLFYFLSDDPFTQFNISCEISANGRIWGNVACEKKDIIFQPCEVGFIKLTSIYHCIISSTIHRIQFKKLNQINDSDDDDETDSEDDDDLNDE